MFHFCVSYSSSISRFGNIEMEIAEPISFFMFPKHKNRMIATVA